MNDSKFSELLLVILLVVKVMLMNVMLGLVHLLYELPLGREEQYIHASFSRRKKPLEHVKE